MDLNSYQREARKLAVYPMKWTKHYPILALCGEVGELANVFKKSLRGDVNPESLGFNAKIESELGDILWYLSAIATDFGMELNDIAKYNLKKLQSRRQAGTLAKSDKRINE